MQRSFSSQTLQQLAQTSASRCGIGLAFLCSLAALPATAQSQLDCNPLPKAYKGAKPAVAAAQRSAVVRVGIRVVDGNGQPLPRALVRVEGAPQQLWADDRGTLSLLVTLEHGPLHLTCQCFGYDEAQLSIDRPEDNNLVFQLFRTAAKAAAGLGR